LEGKKKSPWIPHEKKKLRTVVPSFEGLKSKGGVKTVKLLGSRNEKKKRKNNQSPGHGRTRKF